MSEKIPGGCSSIIILLGIVMFGMMFYLHWNGQDITTMPLCVTSKDKVKFELMSIYEDMDSPTRTFELGLYEYFDFYDSEVHQIAVRDDGRFEVICRTRGSRESRLVVLSRCVD